VGQDARAAGPTTITLSGVSAGNSISSRILSKEKNDNGDVCIDLDITISPPSHRNMYTDVTSTRTMVFTNVYWSVVS
jgi:hypothetical protein